MALEDRTFNGTLKGVRVKPGDLESTVEIKLELPFKQAGDAEADASAVDATWLGYMVGKRVQVVLRAWQPGLPLFQKPAGSDGGAS
jgi:hypothetical protein